MDTFPVPGSYGSVEMPYNGWLGVIRPAVSDGLFGDRQLNAPPIPLLALALPRLLQFSGCCAVRKAPLLLATVPPVVVVGAGGGPIGAIAIAAAVRPGLRLCARLVVIPVRQLPDDMRTNEERIRLERVSSRSAKRTPTCTSSTMHVLTASTARSMRPREMATSSSVAPRANVYFGQ